MGLRENAAAAAGRTLVDEEHDRPAEDTPPGKEYTPAPDPMADYEPGDNDPEMVPVHIAWLRVRREIRAIGKGEKYEDGRTKYNFRGTDTVVQYFGPVTLKHGVNVLPVRTETSYGTKNTKSGGTMRECTATVTWHIMGPLGDILTLQTAGEALDTSDKSTTKAQTVALRNLLLNGGLIPTGERDPDADRIERGNEAPGRTAESYRDEIVDPKTSQGRLRQIGYELANVRMLNTKVQNEVGDWETLDSLGQRTFKERAEAGAR
ncbi:ERF family protein [Streptomyces sp. NPDC057429]|uniref:ERF family protein n=1 Tax=Streptomyces sp. NPDC057429 TaxID=3346130 RepID=UPI0036BE0972